MPIYGSTLQPFNLSTRTSTSVIATSASDRFPVAMPKTTYRLTIAALAVVALFSLPAVALAKDFGDSKDVKQVRTVVSSKFGKVLNVSISHDWALCTAYSEKDESDLSVVLHRTGADWKIKQSDGGAFDKSTLESLGAPSVDIPSLLKAYQ